MSFKFPATSGDVDTVPENYPPPHISMTVSLSPHLSGSCGSGTAPGKIPSNILRKRQLLVPRVDGRPALPVPVE
jgi:hypothetical protein